MASTATSAPAAPLASSSSSSAGGAAAAFHSVLASGRGASGLFCPHCGAILTLPDTSRITCDGCSYTCLYGDLDTLETVTCSRQRPVPSWLQELTDTAAPSSDANKKNRSTVDEECPECKEPKMSFYTMQMRSADEGQTVFYECLKCGYTFSTNT